MPCGCEENPKYDMRFVGWKDGALIKGAPSLPQGWIQKNFIEEATLPHWELVEPFPETKKAPSSDSEESVYEEAEIPEEVVEETDAPPEDEDKSLEIEAEASEVFTKHSGELGDVLTVKVDTPAVEEMQYDKTKVILYDEMTVKALKLFIEERGGTVDRTWLKADLVREARELEEASRTDSVEPETDEPEEES